MGHLALVSTPVSLLRCLQAGQAGQEDWKRLVDRYGPPIVAWCLRRGLQPSDADDVAQDVLIKLYRRLPEFQYNSAVGFRPYLRRLIHSTWCDCLEQLRRIERLGATGNVELDEQEARRDLERQLQEQFDQELLDEALVRVAGQVEPHTFEAFRLQAIEGLPAEQVAQRLEMKIASVYKAKSNVQQRLRDMIAVLEGGEPSAASD